jgi:fructose-specific phosphotransferase system IIC component
MMLSLTNEMSQMLAVLCVAGMAPLLALTAAAVLIRQLRQWAWGDDE